jgi:hypothetical protein
LSESTIDFLDLTAAADFSQNHLVVQHPQQQSTQRTTTAAIPMIMMSLPTISVTSLVFFMLFYDRGKYYATGETKKGKAYCLIPHHHDMMKPRNATLLHVENRMKNAKDTTSNQPELDLPDTLPDLMLAWYGENARPLPWRADRDPYHVWLSEIMLQQTRAEVVCGYYTRFLQEIGRASCRERV